MKNLIKSRRGIAIEMAVVAMFIMIALSIVLISISNSQIRYMKNDIEDFNEKVEVYKITDHILKNHKPNELVKEYSGSSDYAIDGALNENTNKYEYTVKKNENVILTLEIQTVVETGENETKTITNTITSWGN